LVLDVKRMGKTDSRDDNIATPLELARMPARWSQLFGVPLPAEASGISRYIRREIAPGMLLYSARVGAPKLIVGFTGHWMRLMLPVAAILQSLDSSECDLLLLMDEKASHYRHGIGSFADSFYMLCTGIDKLRRGYRHTITLGTSMGALPALRAGDIIGADRAIAIGARFAWDIVRMAAHGERILAFDPLCACRQQGKTELFALYGDAMAIDAGNAARLSRAMPRCGIIELPFVQHNVLLPLLRNGRLAEFNRELFDLQRAPGEARLRALFGNG
jgi:hypothetical protein